jgi:signal transduction histidine kinase
LGYASVSWVTRDPKQAPGADEGCSSDISGGLIATQEEESKAISQKPHDSVLQSLTALIWEVATLRGQIPESDAKAHETLDSIQGLAKAASAQIRDLALLLRPSILDDLGLVAAIRSLVREVSGRTALAIGMSGDELTENLPEGLSLCLYRLTQEALQNAVRHAQARTVHVELRWLRGCLLPAVRRDGIGFDAESGRGLGLLGMDEGLRLVGGDLRIASQPGMGITDSAEIPVACPEFGVRCE